MDDRSKKIQLNNPIPLHFYSPEERMPADDDYKICIVMTEYDGRCKWRRLWYDKETDTWKFAGFTSVKNVIAWASFSPDWVVGVDL